MTSTNYNTETEKIIRLSRIKITKDFENHMPAPKKIKSKYTYYIKFKRFNTPIILDRKNTLVDGYCTYLLARMFGIRKMEVIIQ